ncbi:MAG: hypothetical protein ACOZAM_06495 [Pseudomonadota bacterium]
MLIDHLAQAERHVAEGRKHIARQVDIIINLENLGHDTATARSLLANFEAIQQMHISDRDRLKRELAESPSG